MILIMGLPNSSTVAGCRVDYDNMKYVRSSRVRMTRQSCSTEEIFVQMFLDWLKHIQVAVIYPETYVGARDLAYSHVVIYIIP
jgi:hypothetical protein